MRILFGLKKYLKQKLPQINTQFNFFLLASDKTDKHPASRSHSVPALFTAMRVLMAHVAKKR